LQPWQPKPKPDSESSLKVSIPYCSRLKNVCAGVTIYLTSALLQLRGCCDDGSAIRSRSTQCSAEKRKDDKSSAWESFLRGAGLKSMDSFVDSMDSAAAPRLLNVWTQQAFFLLAGGVTLILLVGLLSVSGQTGTAPSDPRCTLPWC